MGWKIFSKEDQDKEFIIVFKTKYGDRYFKADSEEVYLQVFDAIYRDDMDHYFVEENDELEQKLLGFLLNEETEHKKKVIAAKAWLGRRNGLEYESWDVEVLENT